MPPKIEIKRTKTNFYPDKFTKEKHLSVSIDRKNKPDIRLERHVAKNKNTGEKRVTNRKLVGDLKQVGNKRMTSTDVMKTKDASGNKSTVYRSAGNKLGEKSMAYKGSDKATFRATTKLNKAQLKSENQKDATMVGVKAAATKIGQMEMLRKGTPQQRQAQEKMYNSIKMKNQTKP